MKNSVELFENLPSDGVYKGKGRVSFTRPDGEVRGNTTVTVSPTGDVSVTMEVEEFDIPPEYGKFGAFSLMPFLDGSLPQQQGGDRVVFAQRAGQHEIVELRVEVDSGAFTATRGFVANEHYGEQTLLTLALNDLVFKVPNEEAPADWLLPLIGDLKGPANDFCFISSPSSVRGPGIAFIAEGRFCGVQPFPSREALAGRKVGDCDGIAFGEVGGKTDNIDDVQTWLPSEFLNALRFGVGADIEVPWIDIRTTGGLLIRRIFSRFGKRHIHSGSEAFSRFDGSRPSSGVGEFLRCYFRLPEERRARLIAPMSLIQSGSPGNATIEETIGDLVQALDALCVINDIGRMNLSSGLQPKTADTIRLIADRAKEEMLILRRELSRNGQIEEVGILDKIISRQANVDTSANDFGISVTELCRRFGLLDADVMNAYYLSLPDAGLSWERLLSDVRGAVIHTGGLRVADRQAMQKWFAFIRHLHDICKRLILREVGYKGTYLATNARFTGMYEVDRIDSKTTVEQLGYTEPPTGV